LAAQLHADALGGVLEVDRAPRWRGLEVELPGGRLAERAVPGHPSHTEQSTNVLISAPSTPPHTAHGRIPRMNFARDVVDAAPATDRALVEIRRDGTRREWTFGEVADAAARLAGTLTARGVTRGDIVM